MMVTTARMSSAWRLFSSAAARLALAVVAAIVMMATPALADDAKTPGPAIKFWNIHTESPQKDVLAAAVDRFLDAHPQAQVLNSAQPNDSYKTALEVALHRDPPDVFHTWGGSVLADYVHRGYVRPLSGGDWAAHTLPAALKLCTVNDKLYAAPTDVAVVQFWYNKTIFQKYGIEEPRDFKDLIEACRTLREAGVMPIALGARDRWPAALYFVCLAARLGGPELPQRAANRERGVFLDSAFVEAGRKIKELVDAKAFAVDCQTTSSTEAYADFLDGKAAMILTGNFIVGYARKHDDAAQKADPDAPAMLPQMKAFAFPSCGKPEFDTIAVGGVNTGFAVSEKAPADAEALVNELASPATALDWITKTGRIPARTDIDLSTLALPAQTLETIEYLNHVSYLQQYYDQFLPTDLIEPHLATTFALFAGNMTPEQAADRMEAAAQKMEDTAVSGRLLTILVALAAAVGVAVVITIIRRR